MRLILLGIVLAATTLLAGHQERFPNIVLLLADDLGWQDLGCYGGPVRTPTLDGLAANGVRFTDFHAGASVCSPSRATLLTGRHHFRTGVYHVLQDSAHNAHLLEREVTIAEVLKQAGYATAHFGKWHLGLPTRTRNKPTPDKHGFDHWFATENNANPSHENPVNFIRNGAPVGRVEGYSCQIVVNEAMAWLDSRPDREQPFFLNLWFHEPHAVTAAPADIVSRYGRTDDPAAVYSATVENTDRAIGRLVGKLQEMGALENTLIIYSSDNGSYREDRNGGLRGNKGSNFEGGIRSPGIFCWPRGIVGGRVEHEPAGAVDLLPTICGLASIEKPKGVHLDGADLSPLLTGRGGKFQRQQPLFWHLPTSNPAVAIRDGRYSLVGYRDYDLPQDHATMNALFKRLAELVDGNAASGGGDLRSRIFNTKFANPEAERLRSQYVQLNTFQEAWIPLIKAGGFRRFELHDVAADPAQQKELSAQLPEVAARLKEKLLAIHASVIADSPDWIPAVAAVTASPKPDSSLEEMLLRVDRSVLPAGYHPQKHQEYVDARLAGLTPEQRARIGQLWREQQRLQPGMPNRGASFVRILEFVAAGEPSPVKPDASRPKSGSEAQPREDNKPDPQPHAFGQRRPNVLFIAVDDLNDWIGCLGGHPQARTPNIDRLAAKGVRFDQAYCAAPLCNPSRTAVMMGLRPSTTGIYGNEEWFRDIPKYADWVTLPQYFRQHGYLVWGGGKLYHQPDGKFSDPAAWDERYSKQMGTPFPPVAERYRHGLKDKFPNPILQRLIDWGPIPQPIEETADWKTVEGAAAFLGREHDRPFFLGCGIYLPHLPRYVPAKFFDLHPLEKVQLPPCPENDLDDVPAMGRRMAGAEFRILKQHGQWKPAVQAYLAATSFADACVGRVLDALVTSPHRDNTIVVLWSDHGYSIGEKEHLEKSALWKETTRVPLIIHAPGVSPSEGRCRRPVNLVDLYPTLVELCGLPPRRDLDGRSLAPLVRNPAAAWPYPVLITHSPRWHGVNHAVRSEQYHYIRYRDGGEELYDNTADPQGWKNLAQDARHAAAKEELKKWLPKVNAEHFQPPAAPGQAAGSDHARQPNRTNR